MAQCDERPDESPARDRRSRHPKERLRPIHVVFWLLSPLHLRLREPSMWPRNRYARPSDIPATSRNRQRRRAKRLRLRRRLKVRRAARLTGLGAVAIVSLAALVFWAKFAVVYNLPVFVRHGGLIHAHAYIVLKSWWFGPPAFNLRQYPVDGNQPWSSLATELGRYRGIVTNPSEIVFGW